MNISYNWLKRYLDTDLPAEEIARILTDIGLEVEGFEKIETVKGGLHGVVVGEVLTCTDHPDSDHLHLTTVDVGAGDPLQIVCGAPDQGHPTVDTVHIEMRDPNFTLQAMGVRTAAEGVKGYYPAFDITPPHLVSGVVTDLGIYSPYDLHRYFTDGHIDEHNLVV